MTQKASEVPQNSGVPTPEFRDLSQTSDTGPRTLGPVGMPVLTKDYKERNEKLDRFYKVKSADLELYLSSFLVLSL